MEILEFSNVYLPNGDESLFFKVEIWKFEIFSFNSLTYSFFTFFADFTLDFPDLIVSIYLKRNLLFD